LDKNQNYDLVEKNMKCDLRNNRIAVSLIEMMIAVMILGFGIVVVSKMFGQGGYMVAKSKWELLALFTANGEVEKINLYKGDFDNLNSKGYDWRDLEAKDFPAHGSVPDDYKNAEYKMKVKIEDVNDFAKKVIVSVQWKENGVGGRKLLQLNVPTVVSNPKYFPKLK